MNLSLTESKVSSSVSTVMVNGRQVSFGTNKAGTGLVLVNKKAMKRATGLKGAELNRAHFAYRLEAGKVLNGALASRMASGEILVSSIVPTKAGARVNFAAVDRMAAPAGPKAGVTKAERDQAVEIAAKEAFEACVAKMVAGGMSEEAARAILA